MSLSHSPSIVRNGLIFYYDVANTQKSWKGQPTTNLFAYPETGGWNGSNLVLGVTYDLTGTWSVTYEAGVPNPVNASGVMKVVTGTTGYKYLALSAVATTPGTYSVSYYSKLDPSSATASSNLGNANLFRDTGVGSSGDNATTSGDMNPTHTTSWNRWKITGGITGGAFYWFPLHSGTLAGGYTLYMCGFQFEKLGYGTPFVNGTRSNTQALVDLTGGNTITAQSLTYASDNSFSFNGSANYLSVNNKLSSLTNDWSIECWCQPAASQLSTHGDIWGNHASYQGLCLQNMGTGTQYSAFYGNGTSWQGWTTLLFNLTASVWNHVVITRTTSNTINAYVNGVLVASLAVTGNMAVSPDDFMIGWGYIYDTGRRWNGKVATTSIYNRGLNAAEVNNNFNAMRGRFGL